LYSSHFKFIILISYILVTTLNITNAADCSLNFLKDAYAKNYNTAILKSGGIKGVEERIKSFLEIYYDSNENFIFPLIALHGIKWANEYLDKIDHWSGVISGIPYLPINKELSKVEKLSNGLKNINQKVYLEVYSVYYTIKQNMECSNFKSSVGINDKLSAQIKRTIIGLHLSDEDRLEIYEAIFRHEQTKIVAPQIKALSSKLILNSAERYFYLRPKVRFSYFPNGIAMKFNNFFNTNERIKFGIMAAKIALEVGEELVVDSI